MNKKIISIFFCMLLSVSCVYPMMTLSQPPATAKTEKDLGSRTWIQLPDPIPVDMILEQSVCRRMSFRSYTSTPVTDEELSTVLWAAYGVTARGRSVYSPNGTYSTTMYVIRSDATYIYKPANQSLLLWKTGNYLNLGQITNAPIKIGLVWNSSIAADEKAGMAEIGAIGQGIYFDANALNLGALTTGSAVDDLEQLGLPPNEVPEIIMHLGHQTTPYNFRYDPLPPSNLPKVINNTMTLADVLNQRTIAYEWDNTPLTLLEESQTLWCSYGTSYLWDNINGKRHRTLPSAIDLYPFKIYAANQSGVYQYAPTTHSLSLIVAGDRRQQVEDALSPGNVSVATAPLIIVPFWDKSAGGQQYLPWWWYEAGAICHNVLLEGTALGLKGNVVTVIRDQTALRSALGISSQTNYVGMAAAMVGRTSGGQNTPPSAPVITGPHDGGAGAQYTYTFTSMDVDGDEISYFVDWGDGTTSGWLGPAPSEVPVAADHIWAQKGSYNILAKAKDTLNAESSWSEPYPVTITGAALDIQITGGLGLTITLNNTGDFNITDISWNLTIAGGFLKPAPKTGTISALAPGEQYVIHETAFGFGKKTITFDLAADDGFTAKKTATGFLLIVFFLGVKEA